MKFEDVNSPGTIEELEQKVQALQARYQHLFGPQELVEHTNWPPIVQQLKRELVTSGSTDYDGIDQLMRKICRGHGVSPHDLHDQFVARVGETPDHWIQARLSPATKSRIP